MIVLFLSCVSLPSSCLVFPPVFFESSFCWSTNWTHHRIDRTSKHQPWPLGTRPAPCAHVFVLNFICPFLLSSSLFLSCWPFFWSSFSGVRVYQGYVPRIVSLQVMRDRNATARYDNTTVPLRTGPTSVHVIILLLFGLVFPSRRFFVACFVSTA